MARITGEIIIEQPIATVFDFVADERNEPLYNPALLSSEKVTAGPIGIGTRFHATHKSSRRPIEMVVEITAFERPRRMASVTTMSWSEIKGQVAFEPAGTGTRMCWNWDVRPKGFARVLTPLVGVIGGRSEKACWEGLKHYLEAGRVAPS